MPQIVVSCERSNGVTFCAHMPATKRAVYWVVALAAGVTWALRRLVHTSPFYDEWTLISRVIHRSPWSGAFASFNGHLWVFQDLIYRAQVVWFGAESHWLVVGVFVMVLVWLHASFTLLARAVGVPLVPALAAGLAVTYLGRGAQDFVFAVQVSPMASLAMVLWVCRVVVSDECSRRSQWLVGGLMLLAVLTESGLGAVGMVMVAAAISVRWGVRRMACLLPAGLVLVLWWLFADGGPRFPSSALQKARVAGSLLMHGAGALVGGAAVAGGAVLVVSASVGAWMWRVGGWHRREAALALAGVVGALGAAAAVAHARAGMSDLDLADSNRYVHFVAVPVAVTLVAMAAAAQSVVRSGRHVRVSALLALLGCVAVSMAAENSYSNRFIDTNRLVRDGVNATTVVVANGCPSDAAPAPKARPVGPLSPQVTVGLVAELMERGHLTLVPGARVSDDLLQIVCPNG